MALNRREFMYRIAETAKKGALIYGIGALSTEAIMKMMGTADPMKAIRQMADWNLIDDSEAASLPINYVQTPFSVVAGADCRNGSSIFTTNAALAGDGSSSGTDQTTTALIKNGGTKNVQVNLVGGTVLQQH